MNAQSILNKALEVKSNMDKDMLTWNEPVTPDSYMDHGVRKAVVYGGDFLPEKLSLSKRDGHWFIEEVVF